MSLSIYFYHLFNVSEDGITNISDNTLTRADDSPRISSQVLPHPKIGKVTLPYGIDAHTHTHTHAISLSPFFPLCLSLISLALPLSLSLSLSHRKESRYKTKVK